MGKSDRRSKRSSVTISGLTITGSDIGVRASDNVDLSASNLAFEDVRKPWEVSGPADVRGTRISDDPKLREPKVNTTGWRKTRGPPLPAFCPKCETIFSSGNYDFSGRYFESWDNEEVCPKCGFEHARLSEGIFSLINDTIKVINAPDVTYVMLAAVKQVADDVLSRKIEPKEAVQKVDEISPVVGSIWQRALKFGFEAVTLLCAVVGLYYGREAVIIAKDQLVLAERQGQSDVLSQKLLEEALGALMSCRFSLRGIERTLEPQYRQETSASPNGKTDAEAKRHSLSKQHNAKARYVRRREAKRRRGAFGRSRDH